MHTQPSRTYALPTSRYQLSSSNSPNNGSPQKSIDTQPTAAQSNLSQTKIRPAHTQILLLPHPRSHGFLEATNPGLASQEICENINGKKVIKGQELKDNVDLQTVFKGYQKINQVLRWTASATLAANANLELHDEHQLIRRSTPEVQATILPSGQLLLGSNAIDIKQMPKLLSQIMNNDKELTALVNVMQKNIEKNKAQRQQADTTDAKNSFDKKIIKEEQRLRHTQSLYELVNDEKKAKEFISNAEKECSSSFEKIITRNYLNDIRRALKSADGIKMVAPPKNLQLTHAEQRIFEFVQKQKWQPTSLSVAAWELNREEKSIMQKGTLFPLFIAGTKPPCSSCSHLESSRTEYAIQHGISSHFYAVRAEDQVHSTNGISPAVGELFEDTHTTPQLLSNPEKALPHTLPNDVAFTRRDSLR